MWATSREAQRPTICANTMTPQSILRFMPRSQPLSRRIRSRWFGNGTAELRFGTAYFHHPVALTGDVTTLRLLFAPRTASDLECRGFLKVGIANVGHPRTALNSVCSAQPTFRVSRMDTCLASPWVRFG